jgi:hypothetical protein
MDSVFGNSIIFVLGIGCVTTGGAGILGIRAGLHEKNWALTALGTFLLLAAAVVGLPMLLFAHCSPCL